MNTFKADHDAIIILDFGSQFSHLITRRVRELNVYCEMMMCTVGVEELASRRVKGIILSGGPSSVYEADSPHLQKAVWDWIAERGIPLLGICYGFQEIAHSLGGAVEKAPHREFGHAEVTPLGTTELKAPCVLAGLPSPFKVWMSHGDKITRLPPGFVATGATPSCEFACVQGVLGAAPVYGLQFHPEVSHTPQGLDILRNFVLGSCGATPDWTMGSFLETALTSIRNAVGETAHVLGAVSGGVDSTVAAVLMQRAIGNRFHAIMVDNGLLRKDERVKVLARLRDTCGVDLRAIDASDLFLGRLAGVEDPERKRKIIGAAFIEVFEAEAARLSAELAAAGGGEDGGIRFLLQGTLYPDVIESVSFKGPSAVIKSHHNVGGLVANMKLALIEPLRELFKDEVRALGMALGLPRESVLLHPFPGPGLAIRILGAVDKEACDILREADAIYLDELRSSGEYDKIAQAFAVLLPCRSVGVMGDARTYERVLALRAVASSDFMTADWYPLPYPTLARVSTRVINEVRGVNRIVYDVSSKPPATIEWE